MLTYMIFSSFYATIALYAAMLLFYFEEKFIYFHARYKI